jgi:uncharacterized protein YecE (DUF72 family)
MGKIHIGTSGWSYKHWKDIFYPPKLKQDLWLPFYAGHFSTTEINGSFYKLPSIETVQKWTEKVPENFVFCPKMSRYLTHMKKLTDPDDTLQRFFTVFEPAQHMMGPILIQLPPVLKFNYDRAEYLYSLFSKTYGRNEFVMEVRHDTWLHDDSLTLMTKYDIGLVISQSGGEFVYSEMITASNIYVRFHGPRELYASSYTDEELKRFAVKFKKWKKEGNTVWAYFNNDIHGHAIHDAKRLKDLINKKEQ